MWGRLGRRRHKNISRGPVRLSACAPVIVQSSVRVSRRRRRAAAGGSGESSCGTTTPRVPALNWHVDTLTHLLLVHEFRLSQAWRSLAIEVRGCRVWELGF